MNNCSVFTCHWEAAMITEFTGHCKCQQLSHYDDFRFTPCKSQGAVGCRATPPPSVFLCQQNAAWWWSWADIIHNNALLPRPISVFSIEET